MEKKPLGLLTYKSVYYKNSSKMAPSVMKIITSNTQRFTWKYSMVIIYMYICTVQVDL